MRHCAGLFVGLRSHPLWRYSTVAVVLFHLSVGFVVERVEAADLESAKLALRTKQFDQAVRALNLLAKQGDATAQYLAGLSALNGLAGTTSRSTAKDWLRAAAQQRHAAASFVLASILSDEVPRPVDEIRRLVEQSAAAGYLPAQSALKHGMPLQRAFPAAADERSLRLATFLSAARRNDVSMLQRLKPADLVNIQDEFKRTPLFVAAEAGASESVAQLLRWGADPKAADQFGITPLMVSATQANTEATAALIASGGNVNDADDAGRTSIIHASFAGQPAQIAALLSAGADPNRTDVRGWTALDYAIRRNRSHAEQFLRAKGAVAKSGSAVTRVPIAGDLSRTGALYQGWAPLLIAITRDDAPRVHKLLAESQTSNVRTPAGDSALHLAIQTDAQTVVPVLLKSGFDPGLLNSRGEHVLVTATRRGMVSVVEQLLDAGVRPNAHGPKEDVPLIEAVRANKVGTARALIDGGASVDERSVEGESAVLLAARAGLGDIVSLLISRKADIRAANKSGRSPLTIAAMNGHLSIVDTLLAADSPLDAVDFNGNTAMIDAASAGKDAVVLRLLRAGTSVQAANGRQYGIACRRRRGAHRRCARAAEERRGDQWAECIRGYSADCC